MVGPHQWCLINSWTTLTAAFKAHHVWVPATSPTPPSSVLLTRLPCCVPLHTSSLSPPSALFINCSLYLKQTFSKFTSLVPSCPSGPSWNAPSSKDPPWPPCFFFILQYFSLSAFSFFVTYYLLTATSSLLSVCSYESKNLQQLRQHLAYGK